MHRQDQLSLISKAGWYIDRAVEAVRGQFPGVPATQPLHDPVGLWKLQLDLLMKAEVLLGPREVECREVV